MRGAEFAGRARADDGRRTGAQGTAARHVDTVREAAFPEIRLEAHHRHRRHRREKTRDHHFHEVLGKGRELGVDLELYPRREESKAFEQALDIRIRAVDAFNRKAPGDLRKFARELRGALAHVQELAVVVLEKPRIHQGTRDSATSGS